MAGERILVVDDEPGVRTMLEAILRDEGFAVATAASGEQGLELVAAEAHDAVLLDVWLPGMDGIETLKRLRELRPDAEVVMISGHGTIETAVRATREGAFDFIEKPLALERTLLVLRNALRHGRLERSNRQLVAQLDRDTEIVGMSAAAERLRREVAVAAAADASVLLLGQAGSGRETVARRIHATSARAGQSFVELPCAALDPAAAEPAIYGRPGQPGRLDLARGGTLFLEEVERLAPAVQRRLAGSLEQAARGPAAARPIASTGSTAEGLEPTLLRRLEVIRIVVPPLRERREDIPQLAERFMRELAREYGREPRRFAPSALAGLTAHAWPGNVTELRNRVERILLLAPEEVVEASHLDEELGGAAGSGGVDLYREFESLAAGRRAFERYHVRRALERAGGDRQAAAARLGLSIDELAERLAG